MHRYRVRPFLNQAYYIAIGRAIVTWAALEIRIDEHILRMLRHPKARSIRERDKIHLLHHIPKALKKRLGLFDELVTVIYEDEPLVNSRPYRSAVSRSPRTATALRTENGSPNTFLTKPR